LRKRNKPRQLLKPHEAGIALALAGLLVGSCATVEAPLGPIGDAKGDGTVVATQSGQQTDIECPSVTVRSGASAWQLPSGPATGVRYQGALGQLVRECAILGETMTMRVGVEGRLLVGPKGGPGNVKVPLRLALVAEGPKPQPLWSKFYNIDVTVPPGASQAVFSLVEDDLTFPLPAGRQISNYIIYVGFDPQGAAQAARPAPAKAKSTAPAKTAPKTSSAPAAKAPAPAPAKQAPAPKQPQFEPAPSPPPGVFAPPPGH
jgi:pyruvate/2-oxoglutarate dehydrogenase complex dihydrolipoamide acyltransferase (E2) component